MKKKANKIFDSGNNRTLNLGLLFPSAYKSLTWKVFNIDEFFLEVISNQLHTVCYSTIMFDIVSHASAEMKNQSISHSTTIIAHYQLLSCKKLSTIRENECTGI